MTDQGPSPEATADAPSGALLIYAHPYPARSVANQVLLTQVRGLAGLTVHSLYEDYPDFDIDVAHEQGALAAAEIVIWQHPMYWYSVPGLLKHWFDKVLERGWAYGKDGNALRGKRCLWVTTTGGDERAFGEGGMHEQAFTAFSPVVEQTARFCGMQWLEPMVVHGAHRLPREALDDLALGYRSRVEGLLEQRTAQAEAPHPNPGQESTT